MNHNRLGNPRLLVVVALTIFCIAPIAFGARGGVGTADVAVDIGVVGDPGVPGFLSYSVKNLGPDDAHNVTFRLPIPGTATLGEIVVLDPCQISTPGKYNGGEVLVTYAELLNGRDYRIDIHLDLPREEVPVGDAVATVTASESDPQLANNELTLGVGVPRTPTVSRIRALDAPFRIEITGQDLFLHEFGSVYVGCGTAYRAVVVAEEQDGTRVVIGGGKELKKQFPIGYDTPLTIVNIYGAVLETHYARRP